MLLDTNIVLRQLRRDDSDYAMVTRAVEILRRRQEPMVLVPQNTVEIACVLTRPVVANGFGLSPADAEVELQRIERLYPVLPDTADVYQHWRLLFADPGAVGRQVYDMRLVAAMRAHGLTHLLTINVDDFKRYSGITVLHPRDIS